jgi:hypothetical protein
MNKCNGDRKCLNLCNCTCNDDNDKDLDTICLCGHREHNGICIYVHCECDCNIYDENFDEYIDTECTCGHREHNGNCYLAETPCCEPLKCANYKICKWMCKEEYEMPEFPFCVNCDSDMSKYTNTKNVKKCEICLEDKNILLLDCKHEICNECWIQTSKYYIKNGHYDFPCPFCGKNNSH